MSELTLLQAHERFASSLDALRRKCLQEFGARVGTGQAEAPERVTGARVRFAQTFVDEIAPTIVRELNPDAERDILDALRSYEARFEPHPLPPMVLPPSRWQPSLWRTAIGAAFGAVIGVVLLALDHVDAIPQAAPVATPAVSTPPAGTASTIAPALWLLAAFSAALGAAVGVMLAACPPLEALLARAGLRGGTLSFVQKFGKAFAGLLFVLRGSAFIALAAVLLSALFGVIAWIFSGAKITQILLVIMALATILAARWTTPGSNSLDREMLHRRLLDQLAENLRTDADVWAALSAALVLRPHPHVGPSDTEPARLLKHAIDIIESRRQLGEPADAILQILEQNLGLQPGERTPAPSPRPSEFVWQREHAASYNAFGVVEIGDVVRVTQRPLMISEPDGTERVSQKGVVARKA